MGRRGMGGSSVAVIHALGCILLQQAACLADCTHALPVQRQPEPDRGFADVLRGCSVVIEGRAGELSPSLASWVVTSGARVVPSRVCMPDVVITTRASVTPLSTILLLPEEEAFDSLELALFPAVVVLVEPVSRAAAISSVRLLSSAARPLTLDSILRLARSRWSLPPRLLQLLRLDLLGLSDKEIAITMGLSCQTIEDYQKRLRKRTGARGRYGHLRMLLSS